MKFRKFTDILKDLEDDKKRKVYKENWDTWLGGAFIITVFYFIMYFLIFSNTSMPLSYYYTGDGLKGFLSVWFWLLAIYTAII